MAEDEKPDLLHLNNRTVRFYRDDRVPDPEQNRRLDVSITEEEYEEFSRKYLLWTKQGVPPTFPKLVVRILRGMEYKPSNGRVDLVVLLKNWSFKDNAGTAAYLQSCVPTKEK